MEVSRPEATLAPGRAGFETGLDTKLAQKKGTTLGVDQVSEYAQGVGGNVRADYVSAWRRCR